MATLRLTVESSGPRHYLAGRAVHAGDVLELAVFPEAAVADLADSAVWLGVRYEWSFDPNEEPIFYLALGNGERHARESKCIGLASLKLPPAAVLRWPSEDQEG